MAPEQTQKAAALTAAAQAGDDRAFEQLAGPLKRELHLHCYRILGSFHDAEDAVQQVLLNAWRGLAKYDARASFRTWMYRIATNVSLDALRSRRRRVLPQDIGPARPAELGLGERRHDIPWLEPFPDGLLDAPDPHSFTELRESVRLAFVRALQVLPPRQRAVLILGDVLDWPAAEIGLALDTSTAAVNSLLQRARATVSRSRGEVIAAADLAAAKADMAARYVAAWEAGDIAAIVGMLTDDASHAMPPWPAWFVGRETLRAVYADYPIWGGQPGPGVFRILTAPLNGELGFVEYCRETHDQPFQALALTIALLDRTGTYITEKVSFVSADLVAAMGFPRTLA